MASASHHLTEQQRVDQDRFRGHRGGVISMHRAMGHFHLGPMNLLVAIALCVAFSALWLLVLPYVCLFWRWLLVAGLHSLPLSAQLDAVTWHHGFLKLAIPCLREAPVLPGFQIWLWNCLVTAGLFAATYLVPKHMVPIVYLSRAILLVHVTACVYFAVWPSQFPHTPDSYLQGLMFSSIAIVTVVPLVLGFTYYIFDFGILRKAFLTGLTMAYLALFVPFQVLFQALFLQKTVLYMPLLYIIFAMPADVMIIVAFYSWGMTWKFRERQR
ncbi:MAG: hypothetical protein WCC26_00265 [Terracidiphilus sp.]